MKNAAKPAKGTRFELRVLAALKRLERVGAVRDVKHKEAVKDRDGNLREIDLSFWLIAPPVEMRISVECKSRGRTLSIADIDQVKAFKNDLPARNIFWLISDGGLSKQAVKAISSAGINHYKIQKFEAVVTELEAIYAKEHIMRSIDQIAIQSVIAVTTGGTLVE
jgi:hypothetical protein